MNSSGACHNSLLAHFGLGSYTQAEAITITWPSSYVQVLDSVAADQILSVTEAEGGGEPGEHTIYLPNIFKAVEP